MEEQILKAIYKLKSYRKIGWMNAFQIDEVVNLLTDGYKKVGQYSINRLMEDYVDYYLTNMEKEKLFEQFVKENMDYVADLLKRSKRTVYRKLQKGTFTLVEKKTIEDKMYDNNGKA